YVESYALTSENDKSCLLGLDIEFLWVSGWQRLIPGWLLDHVSTCILGGHGSPDGITKGRGRSPQNWALILGAQKFCISLFMIKSGIDDGDILAERWFSYNQYDDILTSYYKSSLCMGEMVLEFFRNPDLAISKAMPQVGNASYYPQRIEDDGWVDWSLNQLEISRICRALARPYPGLRAVIKHDSDCINLRIWKCLPFDDSVGGHLGVIDAVFCTGSFLVNCGDGRMLVEDWTASPGWRPVVGSLLCGRPLSVELANIIERHLQAFKHLPIAERLLRKNSHCPEPGEQC
ncbi:MAG: hypothetical protein VKM97_07930, partial [Cyanobacteriota bacterium]|nr:hypothetical protein [Cyanobacteriota bacterium]